MIYLRQSTASQEIPLGKFVDSTDGNTAETGLTIANTDIKIWKTGATTLADKNSGGATHISGGEYYCVLDATDTNTIGPMKVSVHVAGALYVQAFCTVLDEAVYDVMFGTTAPATISNITSGTMTTVTNLTNLPAITSNWLTAAGIAASALNGKGDWNVGKTGYALSSAGVQAIWDALTSALTTAGSIGKLIVDNLNATVSSRLASASYTAPLDAAGTRTAVGLASANLDTQIAAIDDYIDTEVAAIKAKTDNLPASPAAVSDIPTANANADALLDRTSGIETSWTLRQALRIILSAAGGKASGLATTTAVYRDVGDTKARITATVDADGNRSAVTLDNT